MHLNPDTVRRYLLGELDAADAGELERHLATCTTCEETLQDSGIDHVCDPFVELLRGPESRSPFDDEPELKRMLGRVERLLIAAGEGTGSLKHDAPRQGLSAAPPHRLGEYELGDPLGSGGMGAVYRGFHRRLRRYVAIKLLKSDRVRDPAAVDRFEREMEAVGRLEHPHIVRALDAGEADGVLYLVMELADGLALSELAQRMGPVEVADACEAIRQASLGIAAAHRARMIHRDVKPGNLMLARVPGDDEDAGAVVKVLDLGLARLHDASSEQGGELTSAGQVMGTVDYMAPEQAVSSRDVGPAADVYSLGATLYRLLAGRSPLDVDPAAGIVQRLTALAARPVPPVESLRPDLPKKLARLIGDALARDPASRPSAAEFAKRLLPFAKGADLAGLLSTAKAHEESERRAGSPTVSSVAAETPTTDDFRVEKPLPDVAPAKDFPRQRRHALIAAVVAATAAILAFGALGAFGLTLFKVRTPHGTIVLEVNEPGAQIEVIDGERVEIRRISDGETLKLSVDPGRKRLKVSKDGFDFFVEEFVLGEDEAKRIVARLEPAEEPTQKPTPRLEVSWKPGPETQMYGLVPRPAKLPGIAQWQLRSVSDDKTVADWSSDGELLAHGDASGTIWIVDAATRELRHVLPGHDGRVYDLTWSPDGRRLASAGADQVVRLWTRDGMPGPVLAGHTAAVRCVSWSPDGDRIASGSHWGDQTVRIWSSAGAVEHTIAAEGIVQDVAWSPDGRLVAVVGYAKEIALFDAVDGSRFGALGPLPNAPTSLAWHADGRLVSNGGDWAGEKIGGYVWDVEEGKPIVELEQPHTWINHLAWSESGELAATTQDAFVQTYDLSTGRIAARTLSVLFPMPGRPSWHSDGSLIAAGNGRIFGFDQASGALAQLHDLAHRSSIRHVAWSADGRFAVTGRDRALRIWSADGSQQVACEEAVHDVCPLAWNREGNKLAHCDGSGVELQVTAPGTKSPETVGRNEATITAMAWGPDDALVAGDESGQIGIRVPGADYRLLEPTHGGQVLSIVWSPDGSKFATSAADDEIHVWSRDGILERTVLADFEGWWHATECSDGGDVQAYAAHESGGTVEIKSYDGSPPLRLGTQRYVGDFAWSPDRTRLATLHPDGRRAYLWNAEGAPISEFRVGVGATDLAWHRDGRLAVVGIDGTIRRWSSDGTSLGFTIVFADGRFAAFSEAGERRQGEPIDLVGKLAFLVELEEGGRLTLGPVEFDEYVRSGLDFREWYAPPDGATAAVEPSSRDAIESPND